MSHPTVLLAPNHVTRRLDRGLYRALRRYEVTYGWYLTDRTSTWSAFERGGWTTAQQHVRIDGIEYYVTVTMEPTRVVPRGLTDEERISFCHDPSLYRADFNVWEMLKEFPDGTPHPDGRRGVMFREDDGTGMCWRLRRYLLRKTDSCPESRRRGTD